MAGLFDRHNEEKKMKAAGRMPPGQVLTEKFPVLHYGQIPPFEPAVWTFKVWGEVEVPLMLTWEQFMALPRTRRHMDLHCVTRWSKFDTEWEGVAMTTLFELGLVKPTPAARFVLQHAEYGYTTNLPLEVMLQDNFLLATHYDGKPLAPEHGYPLRGVVGALPEKRGEMEDPYLWKGAKWLRGMQFLAEDRPGFWEMAGYHNEADIWEEQRFA